MYFTRIASKIRIHTGVTVLLLTISAAAMRAEESSGMVSASPSALAFGRYIAFLGERDVFSEAGPVAVEIMALAPKQGTHATLTAIRDTDASERAEYDVLQLEGDPEAARAIVEHYLAAQAQVENVPHSSVMIAPTNYKFRFIGARYWSDGIAYVFQIRPRKNRVGLVKGQLWIDGATGVPIREIGHFVKPPSSFLKRIEIASEINLHDGVPYARVTRAVIGVPGSTGPIDLTVIESPLKPEEEQDSVQAAMGTAPEHP
jgi:hypothetical protein